MTLDPYAATYRCRYVEGEATCPTYRDPCKKKAECVHWRWSDAAREQRQRIAQVRTVPMPKFETPGGAGHCRWCNGAIYKPGAGHPRQLNLRRGWHDGRDGEPDCLHEFYLHSRREQQVAHVEDRDGRRCWDCKADPWAYKKRGEVGMLGSFIDRKEPRCEWVGRYTEVEYVTQLELEHETPLWKVAHLPDDERRPFFGPANLRLRCPTCHGAKTAREAAERAAAAKAQKAAAQGD